MRQNFRNNVVVTLLVLFFSISNLSSASAESCILKARAESCILKARVTNIPSIYYKDDSGEWSGLTVD